MSNIRLYLAWLVVASAAALPRGVADGPDQRELEALFRPYRTTEIALAPDGRHVAYTVRDGRWLNLILLNLDFPSQHPAIVLGEDRPMGPDGQMASITVPFLQWADADHLVYAVSLPGGAAGAWEEVRIARADASDRRTLVDPKDLEVTFTPPPLPPLARGGPPRVLPPIPVPRRPHVIGFLAEPAGALAVEAVGDGQVPTELFTIDLTTTNRTSLAQVGEPGHIWYDWQGHPRILETPRIPPVPPGLATPPQVAPQTFRLRSADTAGWIDLDRWLGSGTTLAFHHSDHDFLQARSVPLGFGADGNILYFASDLGRDRPGVYALDLTTMQRTSFAVETDTADAAAVGDAVGEGTLVFDRHGTLAGVRLGGTPPRTRWLVPEVAALQDAADRAFPERSVELLQWDDERFRAVVLVSSPMDPGRYFIYETGRPARVSELSRRAPWVPPANVATVSPFEFETAAGVRLTGAVTRPRRARITPVPLVLICPDLPGPAFAPGAFSPEAQALAAQGYMVATLNFRGVDGLGRRHRDAGRSAPDRSAVEDIRAAVAWLAGHYTFDPKRVALLGIGFGGYAALRALELYPADFRAVISADTPLDFEPWLTSTGLPPLALPVTPSGSRIELVMSDLPLPEPIARRREFFGDDLAKRVPAIAAAGGTITKPVFFLQDPARPDLAPGAARALREQLHRRDIDAEYLEVRGGLGVTDPELRAQLFGRLGEFLDATMYDFGVRIGELKEVK